jgi:hypothetical protein
MNRPHDICCNGDCRQGRDCPLTARHPRSMDEAFGTSRFDPVEWESRKVPWLARSVVAATLLLVVLCVGIAILLELGL